MQGKCSGELRDGVTERDVWVPPGSWVDLWRVARYDPPTRTIRPRTGPGGQLMLIGGLLLAIVVGFLLLWRDLRETSQAAPTSNSGRRP